MLTNPRLVLAPGALITGTGFAQPSSASFAQPWQVAQASRNTAIPGSVHPWVKGEVRSVDPKRGLVTLRHDAAKSVEMPAMTMEYRLFDPAKARGLREGKKIEFQADKEPNGNIVVTDIRKAR